MSIQSAHKAINNALISLRYVEFHLGLTPEKPREAPDPDTLRTHLGDVRAFLGHAAADLADVEGFERLAEALVTPPSGYRCDPDGAGQ